MGDSPQDRQSRPLRGPLSPSCIPAHRVPPKVRNQHRRRLAGPRSREPPGQRSGGRGRLTSHGGHVCIKVAFIGLLLAGR